MTSAERIRVLVAEDHEDLRAALQMLIGCETDLVCVGATGSVGMLLQLAGECAPDVVVLDVELGGESGLQALPRLRALRPSPRIVIYSGHSGDAMARGALAAGASAYVVKTGDVAPLFATLRQAVVD